VFSGLRDALAPDDAASWLNTESAGWTEGSGWSGSAPGYLMLDEALAAGLASVTEVSVDGSVPELRLQNLAPSPVLILNGEELLGAKQNRVVNLTIHMARAAPACPGLR